MSTSAPPLSTVTPPLPACGFKEWSLVCEALGAGAQSLILRKGGIHEGRGGFFWKHDRFFLFPTQFHEQAMQFPWQGSSTGAEENGEDAPHSLTLFAEVVFKQQLTAWDEVERLRPFHHWTTETIRERFDYTENSGISLAFLRVWTAEPAWTFPHQARFGGCRSWLDLPDVPRDLRLSLVLDDAAHAKQLTAVHRALDLP